MVWMSFMFRGFKTECSNPAKLGGQSYTVMNYVKLVVWVFESLFVIVRCQRKTHFKRQER